MPRLFRLAAVLVLVLGGSQLVTTSTASAQRADPVVIDASAPSVRYGKQLVLTATLAAAQPGAQVAFYAKASSGPDQQLGVATTGSETKEKLSLPVTRTATYYAVLLVGGVPSAQSAPVAVVVAPALSLEAVRVIGPVYHFNATVRPAADGIPVVLQKLVGKRWKNMGKDFTEDGEIIFNAEIPSDVASRWRLFVRGSSKYGEAASKVVRVIDH